MTADNGLEVLCASLYRLWKQTSTALDGAWSAEEAESFPGLYDVRARWFTDPANGPFVGSFMTEADAAFIAAVHSVLPELVARALSANNELAGLKGAA